MEDGKTKLVAYLLENTNDIDSVFAQLDELKWLSLVDQQGIFSANDENISKILDIFIKRLRENFSLLHDGNMARILPLAICFKKISLVKIILTKRPQLMVEPLLFYPQPVAPAPPVTDFGLNCFQIAALFGSLPLMELMVPIYELTAKTRPHLLAASYPLYATCNGGLTILHLAVQTGNLELVRYLLTKVPDLITVEANGWLPIFTAAQEGYLELVRELIKNGSPLENDDTSVVEIAALNGHSNLLSPSLGLRKKLNSISAPQPCPNWFKNIAPSTGDSPIHAAARQGHLEVIQWYANHNIDLWIKNAFGDDIFTLAAQHGHTHILDYLARNALALLRLDVWERDYSHISDPQVIAWLTEQGIIPSSTVEKEMPLRQYFNAINHSIVRRTYEGPILKYFESHNLTAIPEFLEGSLIAASTVGSLPILRSIFYSLSLPRPSCI